MTPDALADLLLARATKAGIAVPAEAIAPLLTYIRLLSQWNDAINLTSLPLAPPSEGTIDRLLIEPLAAAALVGDVSRHWVDVGSGGGSPAIPFRIVQPRARLTMVESRSRKAAFLREVVRVLELSEAMVVNDRFESFAELETEGSVELVTVRAVRADAALLSSVRRLLSPGGWLAWFHRSQPKEVKSPGFKLVLRASLPPDDENQLSLLQPLFHVEQTG